MVSFRCHEARYLALKPASVEIDSFELTGFAAPLSDQVSAPDFQFSQLIFEPINCIRVRPEHLGLPYF